ncbi:phosphatidate cytidylyltransferase [Campylobacter sp. faydin G-105]|uniref:phosphatidate cytidylyltransferase n=1 Tax=Campylobacter anatolicus TaxID=2829105 RepID=UPI001B99E3DD|nr:phosphatidate cytidylyltransferase [Campylobacter anatolicus]MBR8462236.1 phosphatidate cytidylyltransferase [Campylobacter anatolicus]
MSSRILTGAFMLLAILIVFFINSYLLNFIILGVVLYFAFNEALKLYGIEHKQLVFIALAFYVLTFFTNPIFIAMLTIMLVSSILAHIKSENLKCVLPFIYPTTPIFMIWMLYSEYGLDYLVWLILSVAASDSVAYFVGKAIGKRPFSPSSPSKTIEGVIGGVSAGTIVGVVCASFVMDGFLQIVCASFLVCLFAIWGDLFESYLKRLCGVKDSGVLFPGHGGMLDRIDGYLFGVVALLWALSW